MPPRTSKGRRTPRVPRFEDTLVLQAFLADRLGGNPLDPSDPTHALATIRPGTNPGGPSPFLEDFLLRRQFFNPAVTCTRDELVEYDRELSALTETLNTRRSDPIR